VSLAAGTEWSRPTGGWLFLRMVAGEGYWRGPTAARSLSPGDVLLIPPRESGQLIASQLNAVEILVMTVPLESLAAVATLDERSRIEQLLAEPMAMARLFPAGHAIARRLAELSEAPAPQPLVLRLQVLMLFTTAVAGETALTRPAQPSPANGTEDRFRRVCLELTEAELLGRPPAELARQVGCSLRHFSRLFRRHFGTSWRARQTEARLLRARDLLANSETKVIEVALESGFHHLGLFNTMFKKRFGMTPSQWRRKVFKAAEKPGRSFRRLTAAVFAPVGLLGWLLAAGSMQAATTPTNNAVPPKEAVAPALRKFKVSAYDVQGNTLLPPRTVKDILRRFTGEEVTFDTIRAAQGTLQMAYRERGYATVIVGLPQQTLDTNGIVQLKVTEGRLAEIRIVRNYHFSSNNVMRALPGLKTNTFLVDKLFQAELDRANANRDRQIYPELLPGPVEGTSALQLRVEDRLPLHGRFELNNQCTPGTPDLRINSSIQYDNLWQLEHSVGFQYGFSPQAMKLADQMPAFYDQPLIANYSGFYRLPLSAPTSLPAEVAGQPAAFGYNEATRQFQLPPVGARPDLTIYASRSTTDTGIKNTDPNQVAPPPFAIYSQDSAEDLTENADLGWRVQWPLPEFAQIKSAVSFGADYKTYRLTSYATNLFRFVSTIPPDVPGGDPTIVESTVPSPQPTRQQSLEYLPLAIRWDGSRTDPRGTTTAGLGVNANFNFPGMSARTSFTNVTASAQGDGRYVTVVASLGRVERIYGDWTVSLRADGQWANQPLISNEQFGIGGIAGVRGYHEGEVYGDMCWRVVCEPRTPMWTLGLVNGKTPMRMRGAVFVDYGEAYLLDPQGRTSPTQLWGVGAGINVFVGELMDLRAAVGVPLLNTGAMRAGDVMSHFSFGVSF
jgi:hemolysin activation/secretion protein/AraC-like DNA-binding protein